MAHALPRMHVCVQCHGWGRIATSRARKRATQPVCMERASKAHAIACLGTLVMIVVITPAMTSHTRKRAENTAHASPQMRVCV